MDYFKKIGFVTEGHMESQKKVRDAIRNGIAEIMANMGITDGYVDAMIKQMGFTVEHWKWCDADQMEKIIVFIARTAGKAVAGKTRHFSQFNVAFQVSE